MFHQQIFHHTLLIHRLKTKTTYIALEVPLFSCMVHCGVPLFMLNTQYQIHPAIAMSPSDFFYRGKLQNDVSPLEHCPLSGFLWPCKEYPVAFVPIQNSIKMDDGVIKYNKAKALAACDSVSALLKGGQCGMSDIANVTPYDSQVCLI